MKEKESKDKSMPDLADYMQTVIEQLAKDRKRPAMHTYTYTLKSVRKFYGDEGTPMPVDEVFCPGRLKEYEEWMKRKGLSLNTVSTYLRTLKAVYNRLADAGVLPHQPKLFEDVYTKVEPQTKRALSTEQMGTLLETDTSGLPESERRALAYFRLMFLFRGMPFIDLAFLRKQDIKGRYIVYSRHKTGRQLVVRIPPEAVALMEEFNPVDSSSTYLFPILSAVKQGRKKGKIPQDGTQYRDYQLSLRHFNQKLKKIAKRLLPGVQLSSYVARHTWATLAFHAGIQVGIISKALGHSSIQVTETYLKPFENEKVDAANEALINSVITCHRERKVV